MKKGFLMFGNCYRKYAFTLAEVLITLGIIGVVAAMTLPTVINKYQEKVTVTKLKKFYSILSQSYLMAVKDNGTPDLWGFGNRDAAAQEGQEDEYVAVNAKILKDILFANVKKIKDCDGSKNRESCNVAKDIYTPNGLREVPISDQSTAVAIIDGSGVFVLINSGTCSSSRGRGILLENTCGWIDIDINGTKPPNTIGKDVFGFYLTKYGVIPAGTQDETSHTFSGSARVGTCKSYGLGCTAWVIYNENMDYLKCDDLSWNGKKTCK